MNIFLSPFFKTFLSKSHFFGYFGDKSRDIFLINWKYILIQIKKVEIYILLNATKK